MNIGILNKIILVSLLASFSLSMASCTTNQGGVPNEAKPALSNNVKSQVNPSTKPNEKAATINNSDKKRVKAKGLYLTATSAGTRLKHYIDLANTTEINSYVIDYKDDDGIVCTKTDVKLANEIKAVDDRFDAEKTVKQLHDNNIYAIARIVCFKDPILSKNKPEVAIKSVDGGLYVKDRITWVNPYSKEAWQYNIDLAKEAIKKGFDEVQLDYIRFPDGKKSKMVFGETNNQSLQQTVEAFLAEARNQMPDAVLAGDVFGIICESPGDTEGIGQVWESVSKNIDYVCPMTYPSHYALGQYVNGVKFAKPDMEPYSLIKNALTKAKTRLNKVEGNKTIVRSYLQDFTASWIGKGNYQSYGPEQVRQQIQGLYDAGYEEWILWDSMNTYSEAAFKKE